VQSFLARLSAALHDRSPLPSGIDYARTSPPLVFASAETPQLPHLLFSSPQTKASNCLCSLPSSSFGRTINFPPPFFRYYCARGLYPLLSGCTPFPLSALPPQISDHPDWPCCFYTSPTMGSFRKNLQSFLSPPPSGRVCSELHPLQLHYVSRPACCNLPAGLTADFLLPVSSFLVKTASGFFFFFPSGNSTMTCLLRTSVPTSSW